jgi:hypothetical protein
MAPDGAVGSWTASAKHAICPVMPGAEESLSSAIIRATGETWLERLKPTIVLIESLLVDRVPELSEQLETQRALPAYFLEEASSQRHSHAFIRVPSIDEAVNLHSRLRPEERTNLTQLASFTPATLGEVMSQEQLAKRKPLHRLVLIHRLHESKSWREIANLLGLTEDEIKRIFTEALSGDPEAMG